jgi:hypothetical protein
MMTNLLGYFLCAVIAAGSYASGQVHIFRDCCKKSFVFNHLDLQGCESTQEGDRLTGGCCAPLMSHTLALTAETTQVPSAKQHATLDMHCAAPDVPFGLALETNEYPYICEASPLSGHTLLYQRFARLLI